MSSSINSTLKEAIKNDLPFVIYRLPESSKLTIAVQNDKVVEFIPFKNIDKLSGFLVAPFRGEKINELICLRPDTFFEKEINVEGFDDAFDELAVRKTCETESGYAMTQEEYFDRAGYLVEVLKRGDLRKVVLSRVADQALPSAFNLNNFLFSLIEKYPKAFVYITGLPGFGVWVGATPELLLKIEDDHAETVALAGTQDAEHFKWTEKEIKEQQIVMDYLEELFFSYGISEYGKTGPYTVKAGNVVHLKTRYNLSLDEIEGKYGDLIAGLHPTPAVCGLPRNKAYELIRKVEKHDRGFYSGFLGPWNLLGNSHLYVNLRCAELCKNKISLFVGGGLTAESDPEDEWEETVRKSQTLLSVVENL